MFTLIGLLFATGIFLSVILLFVAVMRKIAQREKTELEQITGGQTHA